MVYLKAGSFTQSNDDPCSPASHCFSSHRCNYCTEAWLAKSPQSKEEDHNSLLFFLPPVVKQKIPPRTTVTLLKCEANWLICSIEMDIGDILCTGCRDAVIIVDAHACLAPTSEK